MSKHKQRVVGKRITCYVSRHSVECRLERYTSGHERLARRAKVRLAQYVAESKINDSQPTQGYAVPA